MDHDVQVAVDRHRASRASAAGSGDRRPGEGTVVVLDQDALLVLARELQDCDCAVVFARRYHSMLPRRVERIATALVEADLAAAMDAVLSLKVSSTTVGTAELAALALDLEDHVRRRDLETARVRADSLAAAADRAGGALADYLATHRAS